MHSFLQFGTHCGSELRLISLSFPSLTFSKDELAFAFAAYPHVEEIIVQGGLLQNFRSGEKHKIAAEAIASHCQSLRKLAFVNCDSEQDPVDRVEKLEVYLHIERNEEEIKVSRVHVLST